MTGYVRKDTTNNIADGNVINAADLDSEFDGVQAAFNSSTGHTHDGTASEGAPITKLGPVQDVTISTTVLGVKTTNTVDLGTSSLKFKDFYLAGNASIGGTLGVTSTATFTGAVIFNGTTTIGDADTDTITQAASYVTGTQLKSAKTATNTLSLAAYDVDGTAYTNLITLTAGNTPTLALTSTGVGTINNMSIGATTASTGAFTTLSASGAVTLSGGTENGVAYLNGSKVLTTVSALVFDGTNFATTGTATGLRLVASSTDAGGSVLQVDTTATAYGRVGGSTTMGYVAGAQSLWTISGSEQMRLTSTSLYTASTINVGIGTSSPLAKLNVSGGTTIASLAEWNSKANTVFTLANAAVRLGVGYDANDQPLIQGFDSTNGARPIGLQVYGGNVGIGTSSPGYKLDVLGNVNRFAGAGVDGIFLSTVAATDTSYYGANYYNNNGTEGVNAPGRASWRIATLTAGSPTFSIGYRAASAGAGTFSTPLTLDASGNLGIGATSPGARLQVDGTAGNSLIRINRTDSTAARGALQWTGSDGVVNWQIGTNMVASGGLEFSTAQTSNVLMTLDTSGNLGIGTSSPVSRLEIKDTTNNTALTVTSSYEASLQLVNGGGSEVSVINAGGSNNLSLRTANTERARIDSSGNVGIAQTDPTNTGVSGYNNLVIGNSSSSTCGLTFKTVSTGTPLPGIAWSRGAGAGANGKVYYDQSTDRLYCQAAASNGVYLAGGGTSWTSASDERVKDIIEPIENATQKLANWRTVIGKYKSDTDGVRRSFLIAQDVLTTFPEAVNTDKAEEYGLNYQDLIPLLVASIQELKAEFDAYKASHP